MAELLVAATALGIASSLLTFADVGLRIMKRLNEYYGERKDVPKIIKHIMVQLDVLRDKMMTLKEKFDDGSLIIRPESALGEVIKCCEQDIVRVDVLIAKMLPEKSDSKSVRAKKAVSSILYEKELSKVWAELDDYKSTLVFHFTKMTTAVQNPPDIALPARQTILSWLSPLTFEDRQAELSAKRISNTGKWFLATTQFQSWLQGSRGSTLWCYGIPGAGKTVISSAVVDHLASAFPEKEVGIAYLYCDYKDREKQTTRNLISSITFQLAKRFENLSPEVLNLYRVCNENKKSPTLEDHISCIHSMCGVFSKTFLVVDALDECSDLDNHQNDYTSERLFVALQKLEPVISLFVASRPHDGIRKEFKDASSIEIRANPSDIKIYSESMLRPGSKFGRRVEEDPSLREAITSTLIERSDGIFLLAQLQMNCLFGCTTPKRIRIQLKDLPTTLKESYDSTMERISNQCSEYIALAMKTLTWILFAKRPLTVAEIQHAMALEPGDLVLDKYGIPDIDLILDVCFGLVLVEGSTGTLRLVHSTLQAYLSEFCKTQFAAAETDISLSCLRYLSLDTFVKDSCCDDDSLKTRIRGYPFYQYAALYWGEHARKTTSILVEQSALEFFQSEPLVSCAAWVMDIKRWLEEPPGKAKFFKDVQGIHLAAGFGWKRMVQLLLDQRADVNARSNEGLTALHWAAWNGNDLTVRLLLEHEADVSLQTESGVSALHFATIFGSEAVVQLLLDRGADMMSRSRTGGLPLNGAARRGHKAIVRILLEHGADVHASSDNGTALHMFALHMLTSNEDVGIAQLLLEKGINVNARTKIGATALQIAARCEHDDLFRLLLAKGADITIQDHTGRNALHHSATAGRESTVRLLLKNGADPSIKDDYNLTAMQWAAYYGFDAVVQLLIENGATTNAEEQLPSLHRASAQGHRGVVQLLLENGTEISAIDGEQQQQPLHYAAMYGHDSVVQLLLDKGAVLEARSVTGFTPLHQAAWKLEGQGHETVLRTLLSRGANIESKDDRGQTALHWAAFKGHASMVHLLLEKGADAEAKDAEGRTPLIMPAHHGYEEVVRILLSRRARTKLTEDRMRALQESAIMGHDSVVRVLLENGVDVEAAYPDGWTALHQASKRGHASVVRLLLEKGADVNAKVDRETPIGLATKEGHEDTVQILVDNDADIEAKDTMGWTALHKASWHGHDGIVQILLRKEAKVESKGNLGETALHLAAIQERVVVLRLLLENDACVEAKNDDGCTALILAADGGNQEVVQILLEKGAYPEAKDIEELTALHKASFQGQAAVVQTLLSHRSEVKSKGRRQQTALHCAAAQGHTDIVRLLIKKGAFMEERIDNKMTVLGLAVVGGFAETVHFLVDEGADVDVKYDDGLTALHFAASKGNEAIVKLLLDKGADPDSRTTINWTPLFYAAVEGQEAIVKLLLEQERVDVNSSTSEGLTPLSMASLQGRETIVRLLLEKGADFDTRDRFGLAPLFRAVEGGHEAVAKLLLDKGADANPKDKYGRKPTKVDGNIYCEGCGTLISHRNAYFQCSICLNSKFHLCGLCIDSGTKCLTPDHEMVRFPAENGNSDGAESITGGTQEHITSG